MNMVLTIFLPNIYTYTKMPLYQGVLNQVTKDDDHSNKSHSTAPSCSTACNRIVLNYAAAPKQRNEVKVEGYKGL